MADLLIQHLKQKGGEHSALAMLVNQWGFDEQLIPKALQTVGSLFPHYSRHDESHSKQILVNIERLLGDNISLLTATDTWLLLEAAYWHDIGMVVPQTDIESALSQAAFLQYVESIRNEPNHELNRFAKSFDAQDMSKCFCGADAPMEAVDNFRQLMAEWFRRQHSERSEKTIQAPWANAGISSPRTELIPARLFKTLGRICQMHGTPFAALLSSGGLPFKEAGLAQEDCHPRFVACLLRMGDLLDLDDNRFCPVMQRIAGENRSHISKAHEDKHAGIRHLRIDRERIEISAECETIDGYLETFKWFDWLKQEMQDQMANWQDIAPSRALGLLPTLGDITVRLSGELQILKEGERPQFSVDGAKAIELLQGNNLYSTKFSCVRELLQNAVDATLLRLWLTEAGKHSSDAWGTPFSDEAKSVLMSTPVKVELTESPMASSLPDGKSAWILTISDQGTGISRSDLAYMLRIGGSQRNVQRQSEISLMPEWMKPSGAFGIGFQSAFLICDEITLTTKSIFTNETLRVEMYSPTGSKEGLVLLKQMENDVSRPYGTIVEIKLLLETFAKSWSISFGDDTSITSQFIDLLDPVLDDSFPFEAAQISDQIRSFASQSPVPIKGKLTLKDESRSTEIIAGEEIADNIENKWNFVKWNGHELAIQYQPVRNFRPGSFKTFYRGQEFESKGIHFPHVRVAVNLMSGKAGAWLTASRDALASHAKEDLKATVLRALALQVRQDLENRNSCELLNDINLPAYSLFLKAMAIYHGSEWSELAQRLDKAWLDLPCGTGYEKLRDYFDRNSWVLGEQPSSGEPSMEGCDLLMSSSWADSGLLVMLNEWLEEDGRTVQVLEPVLPSSESSTSSDRGASHEVLTTRYLHDSAKYRVRYKLMREPQPAYSEAALATRLAGEIRGLNSNERYILNCDDRWSLLFLKKDTTVRASHVFHVFPRNAYFVLLPFLYRTGVRGQGAKVEVTPGQLDAICKWVQPHLVTSFPLADIRKAYEDLIAYIDDVIMRPSIHWDVWKNARGID